MQGVAIFENNCLHNCTYDSILHFSLCFSLALFQYCTYFSCCRLQDSSVRRWPWYYQVLKNNQLFVFSVCELAWTCILVYYLDQTQKHPSRLIEHQERTETHNLLVDPVFFYLFPIESCTAIWSNSYETNTVLWEGKLSNTCWLFIYTTSKLSSFLCPNAHDSVLSIL